MALDTLFDPEYGLKENKEVSNNFDISKLLKEIQDASINKQIAQLNQPSSESRIQADTILKNKANEPPKVEQPPIPPVVKPPVSPIPTKVDAQQVPPMQQLAPQVGPSDIENELKEAQEARRTSQFIATMAKAGAMAGGRGYADTSALDEIIKRAGQPIEDIKEREKLQSEQEVKQRQKDYYSPQSEVSKFAKSLAVQSGIISPKMNISAGQLKDLGLDIKDLLAHKTKLAELATKSAKGESKGLERVNAEMAKAYSDYELLGGKAMDFANIKQLKGALKTLNEVKNLTGPLKGELPDWARQLSNPRALSTRDAVREIVQQSMRKILGAQFTENEGRMLMDRAFDPSQPQEENKKRVARLIEKLENAKKAKDQSMKYFRDNDYNMAGFQGKSPIGAMLEEDVPTNEDKQAIEWAKANLQDPRAKQILDLHGIK